MDHIIKKQAFEFRARNEERKYSPIDCYNLLKKLNVLTVFLPGGTDSKVSGMALKTGEHRFIMVNSDMSLGRQHFTICHELYHLFIQENFVSATCNPASFNKKNKVEYMADLFAMYLLMPEETIYSMIPEEEFESSSISYQTLFQIEKDLQCSHKALINRLLNLGIIKRERYEDLNAIDVKNEARELGFDIALYSSGNEHRVIGDYEKIAQMAFDTEKISESHYVSLLQDIFLEP